ncbi:acyl-CoA thioesterase [Pseudooceanicola aestuarii]|uniref:acyl-CoA thioesterase n=1 Tax=Pseudooceanicola aestuarii TaxID=2697319 RepID=UPI0013D0E5D5|nr:thioesterase family protein [Pseudooceanicola aestuarii]
MAVFAHRTTVMFQHCDPAGIVFYPRYFEMVNEVVETFFAHALDWPFHQLHGPEGLAVPTGRIAVDFHAPSRLGEVLDWSLVFVRLGGASADWRMQVKGATGGPARLTATGTLVLVRAETMKSTRWPDGPRAILERYTEDAA